MTNSIRSNPQAKLLGIGFGVIASLMIAGNVQAQSPAPRPQDARVLAANCANCHGTNGNNAGNFFRLAGQPKAYLIEQMQAFRDGKRQATIMHQIAKGYSDEQIALMAEFFSRQKAK